MADKGEDPPRGRIKFSEGDPFIPLIKRAPRIPPSPQQACLGSTAPTEYLRTYAETRLGSPFVVSITDAGVAYLAATLPPKIPCEHRVFRIPKDKFNTCDGEAYACEGVTFRVHVSEIPNGKGQRLRQVFFRADMAQRRSLNECGFPCRQGDGARTEDLGGCPFGGGRVYTDCGLPDEVVVQWKPSGELIGGRRMPDGGAGVHGESSSPRVLHEERTATRHLSALQRAGIVRAASKHPRTRIEVVAAIDPEATAFGNEIVLALRQARWDLPQLGQRIQPGLSRGLLLEVNSEDAGGIPTPYADLVRAMEGIGVPCPLAFSAELPAGAFRLFVGSREPPPD